MGDVFYTGPQPSAMRIEYQLNAHGQRNMEDVTPSREGLIVRCGKAQAVVAQWSDVVFYLPWLLKRSPEARTDVLNMLEQAEPKPPSPPRIEVAQLDPHTLVGLAEANDGSGGWVVMEARGDGDHTPYTVTPVRDSYGEIIYTDIQDAANVLRTGQVWRHDMGEGEPDEEGTP